MAQVNGISKSLRRVHQVSVPSAEIIITINAISIAVRCSALQCVRLASRVGRVCVRDRHHAMMCATNLDKGEDGAGLVHCFCSRQ